MWHVGSLVQLGQLVSFDSLIQLVSFDCLIACFFLPLLCLCGISFFCNLWASIQFVFLQVFTVGYMYCIPLSILMNTQYMEEHNLYWPSKLFAHFGNRCQWGRSFREFSFVRKFRELSLRSSCFGFVPKLLHLMRIHYCCMVW